MKPAIIERGRGPEIEGSRITVFDVLASTRAGRSVEVLASEWRLSVEQIECALRYIDEHRDEVEEEWAKIQADNERDRIESQARVAAILASRPPAHPEIWEKFQRARGVTHDARPRSPDRCEPSGTNGTVAGSVGERKVD